MKQIPNGDESYTVEVGFYDENGDLFTPITASYTVYNVTEDSTVVTSTSIIVAKTVEIELDGAAVTLVDSTNNTVELFRVCVTVTDGNSLSATRSFEYEVSSALVASCG